MLLILLTFLFLITSSITIFDTRLIQAKKSGILPPDEPDLPEWVKFVYWVHLGLGGAILFINWKYAIVVFIVYFILSTLPVFEITGNIIMRPFRSKK